MPRVIETNLTEEDKKIEKTLRPQCLDDYIGQEKAKSILKIYIEAAKQRHDSLDHVLFYGPPGGDRCHQRRCKRRYSGGEDFSGFRSGAPCKAQGLQRRDERRRTEKGCKAAGMRLSQLHKINRCTGTVWRIRWITRVLEWILKPDTNRWN